MGQDMSDPCRVGAIDIALGEYIECVVSPSGNKTGRSMILH